MFINHTTETFGIINDRYRWIWCYVTSLLLLNRYLSLNNQTVVSLRAMCLWDKSYSPRHVLSGVNKEPFQNS